jgi:hypothetical protein
MGETRVEVAQVSMLAPRTQGLNHSAQELILQQRKNTAATCEQGKPHQLAQAGSVCGAFISLDSAPTRNRCAQ